MNRCSCVARSVFLLSLAFFCTIHAFATQSIPVRLPLVFEPNRGQSPADVRYLFRGSALAGEFRNDGVSLTLRAGKDAATQVRMRLVGASKDLALDGIGVLPGHTNYLLGNDSAHWLRGLPNYAQVRYREIYPGTNLVFYGNGGRLEHDFEVGPRADPSRIAFHLDGADNVVLESSGDLRITLSNGAITFKRPIAYQIVAGQRHSVDAAFTVNHDGSIRFHLGAYNGEEKLVIDPVLSFATYLDTLSDTSSAVATDAAGNTYITGLTFNASYPVTSGSFGQVCAACANNEPGVFVTKLNATGTAQVYSTFLGGSQYNQPFGLAVDSNGNAIVTGYTASPDFPLKNPISSGTPSYADGFVTSLAPDGSSLNFSSRLGGTDSQGISASTFPGGVAVDALGNVYVSGTTESSYLPVTSGALNAGVPSYNSGPFVFLTKFQPSGNLVYSALLGNVGEASECCSVAGLAVDSAQNVYVAGTVGVEGISSTTPWPITTDAYQSTMISPGDTAPFAAKVSADGSTLLYSTLVTTGEATGMALDANGEVILVGTPNYNYPVTPGAYSSAVGSSFIAKVSADGSQLLYSSYFGGSQSFGTTINAVALDGQDNMWLAGSTNDGTFPLVNPLTGQLPVSSFGQSITSFLSEFDPTGTHLQFSTFMGDLSGNGLRIAMDSNGKVHAAGTTAVPIYTTSGAFIGAVTAPPANVEYTYPYATLIDSAAASPSICLGSEGLFFGYLLPQTTQTLSVQVSNCGNAPLTISSIASSNAAFSVPTGSNGCTGSVVAGSTCTVGVEFAPTSAQTYTGQLTFTSNASIPTTTIPLSGAGAEPVAAISSAVFEPLLVGQTSSPGFVSLLNNGFVPMSIGLSQVAVTGDFALAPGGTCTASLPANSSCIFSVTFTPTAAGSRTGTLSVPTSDPIHPVISASLSGTGFTAYPVPTITSLLNPSYPINSGTTPITVSVTGTNFFPASVVYVNGVAQATTYQGNTFLTFSLDPTLVNTVGQIPVTVVNPTPGGGTSGAYPLTGYLSIPLTASALTVDRVGGVLYAAIPASAARNPSTVIPINPATGAMMTPIAVSSNPQQLAVSDDGSELYVASTGVLQRINLKSLAIEKTFNLPVDPEWGQTYVREMHVVPGSPQSIVVELFANVDPAEDGAALYNDSGLVAWIPGQSLVNSANTIFWLDSFTFTSSPSMIYGLPMSGTFFSEVQVSPTGLSLSGNAVGSFNQQTGSIVRSDGTLLYTNSGQVWNPTTQTLLGTYLESSGSQLFYAASVVPDTANGHTYFLDGDAPYGQTESLSIDVYNQANYSLAGTVPFLGLSSSDGVDLVRWGSNGFAFRMVDISGQQPSANEIIIVTSNLVGSTSAAPVPILASVSPASVNAGGPAFTMQLIGSGFTTASTALVNGNPRVTTYVSSTSLTAQVLASDIAASGQLSVQVATPAPGGGTSDSVVVSIKPTTKTTPTVALTPSSTSITTAQPLTVTVAVSGGSGKPTPTGSVTLTSGGYASAAATLTGGATIISVPAGSLALGTNILLVTYLPDSAGSSAYNSATGSSTVTVTSPIGTIVPTITVKPSSGAITNAQSEDVAVTVAGTNGQSTPTGTVTLSSGSYSAQQTLSSGAASFSIAAGTLTSGTNTLTATYAGDATYASASGTTTVTISQITISVPAPSPVSAGSSANTTVTLAAGNNYSGTMNLTCTLTDSPTGAVGLPTCTLNPASITIASGGSGKTSLTMNTTAASGVAASRPLPRNLWGMGGGGALLAVVLIFSVPSRRNRTMLMLAVVWLAIAAGTIGCGGSGNGSGGNSTGPSTPATTRGNYIFTVTGTDSANATISSSASVTLNVQ